MEKEAYNSYKKNIEAENTEDRKDEVNVIRHSESPYQSVFSILEKDPNMSFDSEKQIIGDLTEEGEKLAKQEAQNFLSQLNPEKDTLFFASSNEVRALETAKIYKDIARKMNFEIITPINVRGRLANKIGEGEIRVVKNLSLNNDDILLRALFLPKDRVNSINWEKVSKEFKEHWDKARKIIENDDCGSWGDNFMRYSEEIKEIFPNVKTAKELYDTQFKNIVKLIKFSKKKINESEKNKNIKILAFGHENYLGKMLDECFGEENIKNCECINFKFEGDKILANFRNKEKEISRV